MPKKNRSYNSTRIHQGGRLYQSINQIQIEALKLWEEVRMIGTLVKVIKVLPYDDDEWCPRRLSLVGRKFFIRNYI